ncbi:MAG: hypothetical protein K9G48_13990 [Reyranella sp.]|nr:hypothetical protein [Reyranella sp.]
MNNEPSTEENADAHKQHLATIIVDSRPHKVRQGPWVVKDLKAAVGVDPAKVLAEITHQGLKDLADDATVEVRAGLKFMSHARSGGAS